MSCLNSDPGNSTSPPFEQLPSIHFVSATRQNSPLASPIKMTYGGDSLDPDRTCDGTSSKLVEVPRQPARTATSGNGPQQHLLTPPLTPSSSLRTCGSLDSMIGQMDIHNDLSEDDPLCWRINDPYADATRIIAIEHLPSALRHQEFEAALTRLVEAHCADSRLSGPGQDTVAAKMINFRNLEERNLVSISFHDIRRAIELNKFINEGFLDVELCTDTETQGITSCFVPTKVVPEEPDGDFYLTISLAESIRAEQGRISSTQMIQLRDFLLGMGELRVFERVVDMWDLQGTQTKICRVEFFDVRKNVVDKTTWVLLGLKILFSDNNPTQNLKPDAVGGESLTLCNAYSTQSYPETATSSKVSKERTSTFSAPGVVSRTREPFVGATAIHQVGPILSAMPSVDEHGTRPPSPPRSPMLSQSAAPSPVSHEEHLRARLSFHATQHFMSTCQDGMARPEASSVVDATVKPSGGVHWTPSLPPHGSRGYMPISPPPSSEMGRPVLYQHMSPPPIFMPPIMSPVIPFPGSPPPPLRDFDMRSPGAMYSPPFSPMLAPMMPGGFVPVSFPPVVGDPGVWRPPQLPTMIPYQLDGNFMPAAGSFGHYLPAPLDAIPNEAVSFESAALSSRGDDSDGGGGHHSSRGYSHSRIRDPATSPDRNQLNIAKIEGGHDTRTTVMVKNIPNKMTDKDLIQFISKVCPRKIDFLYLRMDFNNGCNVGYAFVNFINVQDLLLFAKKRLGTKWNLFSSEKVLQMSYANYQGKEALVEKFKNSCIMDERESWRPKIFYSDPGPDQGLPEPFPAPTHLRRKERSSHNRGALFAPGTSAGSGGLYHAQGSNARRVHDGTERVRGHIRRRREKDIDKPDV